MALPGSLHGLASQKALKPDFLLFRPSAALKAPYNPAKLADGTWPHPIFSSSVIPTGCPGRTSGCCTAMGTKPFLWLPRSEEHTSELQSRVDISYAVFCL